MSAKSKYLPTPDGTHESYNPHVVVSIAAEARILDAPRLKRGYSNVACFRTGMMEKVV